MRERGLDPLAARRPHLELYIRSMQEIRRFRPSTVSRRFSVVLREREAAQTSAATGQVVAPGPGTMR